jgi:hypothetical protein
MTTEDASDDVLVQAIARLPVLVPDPSGAERIRARCHAAFRKSAPVLESTFEQRRTRRPEMTERLAFGSVCLLYLLGVLLKAAAMWKG